MRLLLTALLGLSIAAVCRPAAGDATSPVSRVYKLRVTTMVPPNRNGHLEVKKWKRDVEAASGGRLKLRLIPWRYLGTDEEIMLQLRTGKLDAANLGTHAISSFVRQAKILQAPGVYRSQAHRNRAQQMLEKAFQREAYENGFKLISWAELTPTRILSRKPIREPKDLAGLRAWRSPDNTLLKHLHAMKGAMDTPLPLGKVHGALRAGELDVVYGTAGGFMALQWFSHLRYISDRFANGQMGFVMGRRRYDSLPPELAEIFVQHSEKLTRRVVVELRREDEKVFRKLTTRGLKVVEVDEEAWHRSFISLRERLVGDEYTRDLMDRVRKL